MKRVQGMLSIKRASGNIKNDNEPKIPLSGDFSASTHLMLHTFFSICCHFGVI